MGETSGVALRALSLGRPLVVSDLGWFAELPDEVALKIPVDEREPERSPQRSSRSQATGARASAMSAAAALRGARARPRARRRPLRGRARGGRGRCRRARGRRRRGRPRRRRRRHRGRRPARGRDRRARCARCALPSSAAALRARPWERPSRGRAPCRCRSGSATLVVVSAAVRFQLARGMVAPWIMVDELIYSELAKSFASTGHFLFRGLPTARRSAFVYPVLISPAWKLFASIPHAYAAAKAINCLAMSLAALPAYLLARRLVGQWPALLAAVLSVAIPSLVYTGTLMTENAFYPLFLLARSRSSRYLERPSLVPHSRLLGACRARLRDPDAGDRAAAGDPRRAAPALGARPARPARPASAPVAVRDRRRRGRCSCSSSRACAATRRSPCSASTSRPASSTTRDLDVARWFLYHLAELDLYVGVLPFAALLALAGGSRACRARTARSSRPSCRVSVSPARGRRVRVAPRRRADRGAEHLLPRAAAADRARGLDRPRRAATGARDGDRRRGGRRAPGRIPFTTLINVPAISDTLSLLPWWWLQDHWITLQDVQTVVVVCSILLGLLFVVVPRRFALVLPVVVLAYFAFEQHRSRPARTASGRRRSARSSSATRARTATGSTARSAAARTCRCSGRARPRRSRSGRTSSSTAASGASTS